MQLLFANDKWINNLIELINLQVEDFDPQFLVFGDDEQIFGNSLIFFCLIIWFFPESELFVVIVVFDAYLECPVIAFLQDLVLVDVEFLKTYVHTHFSEIINNYNESTLFCIYNQYQFLRCIIEFCYNFFFM